MKNTGVRYGLLGGVVAVFYYALLYVARKELFLNPWLQWAGLGIYLLFMYRAAKEDCAANGTQRDFREILRTPFVVFLLINLCYWLFYYSLHLADPELLQLETAAQLEYFKAQLEAGPGDPEQANQLREQIQYLEKTGMSLPLGHVFLRMGFGALGGFALSAGLAALLRNEQ
ncbi:MAG: DUF4199 family protein [Saprospiraceae bacterium]|nr:DUF4199 family protein [Saprospiraceae bacterium]